MNIDYDKILQTIVSASTPKTENKNKNFLKIDTIGNVITGRLLPWLKDSQYSLINHYHHGWKSKQTGTGLFYLCPNSYFEKCPICSKSVNLWRSNDPILKKVSEPIRRRQNWIVNFYVISDQKNPENNGTVKILKFGKQISDKIKMAQEGADKDIYGQRIWRLDEQGCNFRIITEKNSSSPEGWPTYNNSGFLPPSAIAGMTSDKMDDILTKQTFDLTTLFKKYSYEELTAEMNKHYFTDEIATISPNTHTPAASPTAVQATTIVVPPPTQTSTKEMPNEQTKSSNGLSENELDQMLADLQNS